MKTAAHAMAAMIQARLRSTGAPGTGAEAIGGSSRNPQQPNVVVTADVSAESCPTIEFSAAAAHATTAAEKYGIRTICHDGLGRAR